MSKVGLRDMFGKEILEFDVVRDMRSGELYLVAWDWSKGGFYPFVEGIKVEDVVVVCNMKLNPSMLTEAERKEVRIGGGVVKIPVSLEDVL